MKFCRLERNKLFNGVVSNEFFKVENENLSRVWELFKLYTGKRSEKNYSKESYDNLISENRFSYGFIVTKLNDEIISFYGLSNFNNWAVVTRYACLKYCHVPFSRAYSIPYTLEKLKLDSMNGIVFTFNDYNSTLFLATKNISPVTNKKQNLIKNSVRPMEMLRHNSDISDHEVFKKSSEISDMIRILPYTVWYKNTIQYVSYIPLSENLIPPFEKYTEHNLIK